MLIVPSILTNNPDELKEKMSLVEGLVGKVQIDIIDGVFANNKTIDPQILEDMETPLEIDFHLMTKEPINWIEHCVRGGATLVIGQVEMMQSQRDFIAKCQEVGCKAGLAIDLASPLAVLDKEVLTDIDAVLVMSVKAGFGGQRFDPGAIEKIKELVKAKESDITPFKIIVDGGVTKEIAPKLASLGVDEVVIGKRLFEGEVKTNIQSFLAKIKT
jgi:ribulose-phosphate 3-epimerase